MLNNVYIRIVFVNDQTFGNVIDFFQKAIIEEIDTMNFLLIIQLVLGFHLIRM